MLKRDPVYVYLVVLLDGVHSSTKLVLSTTKEGAEKSAQKLAQNLKSRVLEVESLGEATNFYNVAACIAEKVNKSIHQDSSVLSEIEKG